MSDHRYYTIMAWLAGIAFQNASTSFSRKVFGAILLFDVIYAASSLIDGR